MAGDRGYAGAVLVSLLRAIGHEAGEARHRPVGSLAVHVPSFLT